MQRLRDMNRKQREERERGWGVAGCITQPKSSDWVTNAKTKIHQQKTEMGAERHRQTDRDLGNF